MYYLTPNDFQGKFALHTGMYTNATIQDYIDRYEPLYLMQLFGAKMFDDYVSDMGVFNIPISPNYQYLFNPFHENYAFNRLIVSNGIIDMLKGFIYFEYCKDLTNQMTVNGNVRPVGENSGDISTLYSMMYARYNEAVRTFRAIQTHIVNNFNAPTGQIVVATQISQGSLYVDNNNVPILGGSGMGATATITTNGGLIESVIFDNKGLNYQAGDVITISGGNNDAQLIVDIIGKGNYNNFSGVHKQFNYWI